MLIRSATLIDVVSGELRPGTSVLIEGERIAAVGPDATFGKGDFASVLEAEGMYLLPGFIDSHVHLFMTWGNNWPDTIAELGWILASGVTTIREAGGGGDRAKLQESYIRLREAIDAGLVEGPRMVVSGTAGDLMRLTGAKSLAEAFERFGTSGLDQYKIMSMAREEAIDQIRLAGEAGVTVWGHHAHWFSDFEVEEYALAAIQAGLDGLTHAAGRPDGVYDYPLSRGVRWNSSPSTRALAALAVHTAKFDTAAQRMWIERVVREGVWLEPTLAVTFAGNPLFYGRCTEPVDLQAVRAFYPFYRETVALPLTPQQAEAVRLACDRRFRFIRSFHEAGGTILAGTDEVPFTPLGVQWGMNLLVLAGLPPLAALQAATVNSAKALDLGDHLGTIEPGKYADLVLLEGNPLVDIRSAYRVSAVIAGGRRVDRDALLARLGTNPPMLGAGPGLDGLSPTAVSIAQESPDSVIEFRVLVNDLFRPEDFPGVERWVPAALMAQVGDTLVVRGPARVIPFLAGVRFVRDIVVR